MKQLQSVPLTFLIVVLLALPALGRQSERHFHQLQIDGKALYFSYYLPDDFDPGKSYPVLIGPVDSGPRPEPSFYWRSGVRKLSWILVETAAMFENQPDTAMILLLDHLLTKFKVEGGKFHMVGFSANSGPVFEVGTKLAERLHSITGIPGHPRQLNEADIRKLKQTRIQFIVGENDRYWLAEARRTFDKLHARGADVALDIIEDGEHVLRNLVGQRFLDKMERMRAQ